jgi:hypothetical protein
LLISSRAKAGFRFILYRLFTSKKQEATKMYMTCT